MYNNLFVRTFLITIIFGCLLRVASAQQKVVAEIDLNKTFQTIDNFGASDAWSCQFAGKWPDEKRNRLADLLFSMDTLADGQPKGIGLSLWRFNLGAGSAQQGEASGIHDEWRRAESFLDSNGQYNWKRAVGQVWFLQAAKARGVEQFLGFCNSAPVQFTNNGKSFTSHGKTNIDAKRYDDFAAYLANVVKGIKNTTGITFNYISPVNEPQWDWSDGGQEGCPYHNDEIVALTRSIDKTLIANALSTKILIGEAGSIEYLYKTGDKTGKGDQVNTFFQQGSSSYIGDVPSLSKKIAAHSYFTTSPNDAALQKRTLLVQSIAKVKGLKFWQSEYCILGDNAGEINGGGRDLGMKPSLYLAKVIHNDLTSANASAWQWWTAISAYDYKDGLIYIDKNNTDGNVYESKMLWAMGNYSRFIRPGAVRVSATQAVQNSQLLISAYKQGKNFTAVIINTGDATTGIDMHLKGGSVKLMKTYTTSANGSLKAAAYNANLVVEAQSITTITGIFN